MSISVLTPDRITMSQMERNVLKIMHALLRGERTQAQAARLLDKKHPPEPTPSATTPSLIHGRGHFSWCQNADISIVA